MESDIEEYLEEPDPDETELLVLFNRIKEKVSGTKVTFEEEEDILTLKIPAGRSTRDFHLMNESECIQMLAVDLEKYSLIESYDGIIDHEEKSCECLIKIMEPVVMTPRFHWRRVLGPLNSSGSHSEDALQLKSEKSKIRIHLGAASNILLSLSKQAESDKPNYSIKLFNLDNASSEYVKNAIETISNSLFFQIDLLRNITLALARHPEYHHSPFRFRRNEKEKEILFPSVEYGKAPISLYFYAKSAFRIPLLRFLAFYQSIEFFFPLYSQKDVKEKVSKILKDPTFRAARDEDVLKIIEAVKPNGYSGFGTEKNQLKTVIINCIEPDEIRTFIESSDRLKTFYNSRYKSISKVKIQIESKGHDLRADICERIYDIRCKIVHSKGENGDSVSDFILPFTSESDLLYYDIDVIEFVSKRVLVSNGGTLLV